MDIQTQVFLFYLILTIVFAIVGSKTQYEYGMMYGGLIGVVVSILLWHMYGKKMIDDATTNRQQTSN